jgi:acetolactate synthase I/II/III large subunit
MSGSRQGEADGANKTHNRFEGGDLLVQALIACGVRQIFSVSGGPLNSIYRACAAHGLPLHHTRHEAAAGFMAEAVSRCSGIPGVAAVTLGPGVTNAVTPALVAKMASVPLLIIGAQSPTRGFDRGAGMSADHVAIMQPVTKWAARVLHTDRIPEYLEMAWRCMWAGSPGPVFLEIPVDILTATAARQEPRPFSRSSPGLSFDDAERVKAMAADARRPILIIGNDVRWDPPPGLKAFIEDNRLPFVTMRLARGAIDEHNPQWAGPGYTPCNPALRTALSEATTIILLGHSFEFDLDFGALVQKDAKVLQSTLDPLLLGRNRRADAGGVCAPSAMIAALRDAVLAAIDRDWVGGILEAWREERKSQLEPAGEPMHPVAAIDAVAEAMPAGTVFVTSHGNVDFWADARLRIRGPGLYLRAGQAGALGAEIPYGVGASFADPGRPVAVFVGDGGAGYHITELETAVRYDRPIVIVVLDDEKWAAIALPQRQSHGEEFEMDLPRRDWAGVAKGLGGDGYFAATTAEILEAVAQAFANKKPALIQVPVRAVLSPYMAYISR